MKKELLIQSLANTVAGKSVRINIVTNSNDIPAFAYAPNIIVVNKEIWDGSISLLLGIIAHEACHIKMNNFYVDISRNICNINQEQQKEELLADETVGQVLQYFGLKPDDYFKFISTGEGCNDCRCTHPSFDKRVKAVIDGIKKYQKELQPNNIPHKNAIKFGTFGSYEYNTNQDNMLSKESSIFEKCIQVGGILFLSAGITYGVIKMIDYFFPKSRKL